MLAAELSMMLPGPYKIRTTRDGGKTWATGVQVGGLHEWMQPVWTDPTGNALYTMRLKHIELSKDQGQSWMR